MLSLSLQPQDYLNFLVLIAQLEHELEKEHVTSYGIQLHFIWLSDTSFICVLLLDEIKMYL